MSYPRIVASVGLMAALVVAAPDSASAQGRNRGRAAPRGSVRSGRPPVQVVPYRNNYYRGYRSNVNLGFFYGYPGYYGSYAYGSPYRYGYAPYGYAYEPYGYGYETYRYAPPYGYGFSGYAGRPYGGAEHLLHLKKIYVLMINNPEAHISLQFSSLIFHNSF